MLVNAVSGSGHFSTKMPRFRVLRSALVERVTQYAEGQRFHQSAAREGSIIQGSSSGSFAKVSNDNIHDA